MEEFDLIVIGGGPSGYAAAMRGIDFGKRICLIEKDKVGGAGVYNGALSSKTLWELSTRVIDINDMIVAKGRSRFELKWEEARQILSEAIFERKFQYSAHIKLMQTESMNNLLHYEKGKRCFWINIVLRFSTKERKNNLWSSYHHCHRK